MIKHCEGKKVQKLIFLIFYLNATKHKMLCNTCYAISIYMKNIELSQNLTKKKN